MHFPVFSLILGLLVVVHASPLKSANQPVSSIKDAPKLVPRSSPESAGNTTPAEVAYMQCIALWARQQLVAILNGRGPTTAAEEIQAHEEGEGGCYRLITAQYPTGLRLRFTKAGTDAIINGYLRTLRLPGRPDAEPKTVPIGPPGIRDSTGRDHGRSNGKADGNGQHAVRLEDLSSKAIQGWNGLSAAVKDSVPKLRTLASVTLHQALPARPPPPGRVSLPKLALVPRSEMPRVTLARRSNTPPAPAPGGPLVPRSYDTHRPHGGTAVDWEYDECIEKWALQQANEIIKRTDAGWSDEKQEIRAHDAGEGDCYTTATIRHRVGPSARYTKAGTDAIISRILHERGYTPRPDRSPKWQWAREAGKGGDGWTDGREAHAWRRKRPASPAEIVTGRPERVPPKRRSTADALQDFQRHASQAWDDVQAVAKQPTFRLPDLSAALPLGAIGGGFTTPKIGPSKAYPLPVGL